MAVCELSGYGDTTFLRCSAHNRTITYNQLMQKKECSCSHEMVAQHKKARAVTRIKFEVHLRSELFMFMLKMFLHVFPMHSTRFYVT